MSDRVAWVLPDVVDEAAALLTVQRRYDDARANIDQRVWFPYYYFDATCRVPTLFGRRLVSVPCLVDAISGMARTCDPFAPREAEIGNGVLLNSETDCAEATRSARNVVAHRLGKRARMIADFKIQLSPPRLLYRGFWIVRSGGRTVMVDSVTGALQSMQDNAA